MSISNSDLVGKTGLVYVSDSEPGIRRERRGKGFCYRLPNGALLTDDTARARIQSLGVPPAYRNVWICAEPNGHIQATGRDARGRKQYRYHAEWQSMRGESKFHQLVDFGEALPTVRRRILADIDRDENDETATLSALIMLLDAAYLRVGNKSYASENGTYGATTLLKRHIAFGEDIRLTFAAKGGRKVKRHLKHPRLQKVLEEIADLPGRALFVWQDEEGQIHPVDSGRLNGYLAGIAGLAISAKTFRTWGGTLAAFKHAMQSIRAGERPTIKGLCAAAADELHNTPAVCRKSYVHPAVLGIAQNDKLLQTLGKQLAGGQPSVPGLRADEARLLQFLKVAG